MAPARLGDHVLGERDHDDGADTRGRPGDGERHAEPPRREPAAEQRGGKHARHAGAAEAHDDAEAEIELPEMVRLRGAERRERRGRHADHGERAQAETIDDPAGKRCTGAAGQQGEAIDHRHRAAARAEPAFQRRHEHGKGVADRTAGDAERKAQRDQQPRHVTGHAHASAAPPRQVPRRGGFG